MEFDDSLRREPTEAFEDGHEEKMGVEQEGQRGRT